MELMPQALAEILARRFAAMGHPVRLQILHLLLEKGEMNLSRLVEASGLAQPSVSKHMNTLVEVGLVRRRRDGTRSLFEVHDPTLANICEVCCARVREEVLALGAALGDGI